MIKYMLTTKGHGQSHPIPYKVWNFLYIFGTGDDIGYMYHKFDRKLTKTSATRGIVNNIQRT